MKKSVIILLHVCYWLLYIFLLLIIVVCMRIGAGAVRNSAGFMNRGFAVFLFLFAILPAVAGYYTAYGPLFSGFLKKKKIALLFIAGIAVSFVYGITGAMCISLVIPRINVFSDGFFSAAILTSIMAVIALFNGGMGLIIKAFINWYADIRLKEELDKKNYETELALVKSQIDPHFLFNTINNIDVLIENDPHRASSYLNGLSDIMRFMLYETKTEKIPLEKELSYIEKYIALQKIRSSNPDYVTYHFTGEEIKTTVAPMIFIPFIENAFKHAENKKTGQVISITLRAEKNNILFECENSFSHHSDNTETYGGLGNGLIKRRLELLYPNRHTLAIRKTPEKYSVSLSISL